MCGIAGYSIKENSLPGTQRRLEEASSLLSHRGPDGSGIYFDNRIGLAHRRLAIIDIKGGTQPLTDATGEITIVFNGEIYNFSELKHDLEKKSFPARSGDRALLLNQPMRYLAFLELFPSNSRKLLFNPSGPLAGKIEHPTAFDLIGSFYNQINDDELDRLQITDINTYLPGDILFYSDHMSMAHGLELRSPFLDHDVMEFALSLPSEYRMTTDRKGKRILRDAFPDRISKAMFERPKKGFSIPLARWIGGPLKNRVQEVIMDAPDDFYRLFEKQGVSSLLNSEIERDGLKARQLWSLFILAKWMAQFKAVLP